MRYTMAWSNGGGVPEGVERHCPILWKDFEPRAGAYNFAQIDRWLAAQQTPVHLQIVIAGYGKEVGLVDFSSPAHKRSLKGTAPTGQTGEIPNYADRTWREAYWAAQDALLLHYRDHPQVVAYQAALGYNQEAIATTITPSGIDWNAAFAKLLNEQGYYDFLLGTVQRAVRVAGRVPVYAPALPAPGGTWGHRRRDVIINLLRAGARYLHCGLLSDNSNAFGLEEHAGTGGTDIIQHAPGCAFEGGKEAGADPMELYWMLLRALRWQADFVQLQESWYTKGHWRAVKDLLPSPESRWLVFRDSEWPRRVWQGANGKSYGMSGEIGPWSSGVQLLSDPGLRHDAERFDRTRWATDPARTVEIAVQSPAGEYRIDAHRTDGVVEVLRQNTSDGRLLLPSGQSYHRVDVRQVAAQPVPDDEPVATAQKVRWWVEEGLRQYEAGQLPRMAEILYSLVQLARRLENAP